MEQIELTTPWQAVKDAGGTPILVAPEKGTVQAFNNDVDEADTFDADEAVGDSSPELVRRAGAARRHNQPRQAAHRPRKQSRSSTGFATGRQARSRRSVHVAPWTLIEADLVRGKTLTSWPSLQTDIRNAGGEWRDVESFTCPGRRLDPGHKS